MPLALSGTALRWYSENRTVDWNAIKSRFQAEFGKNKADLDLAGGIVQKSAIEDPSAYVYHVLNYLQISRPTATLEEKLDKKSCMMASHYQ